LFSASWCKGFLVTSNDQFYCCYIDSSFAESDKSGVSIFWDNKPNKQHSQSGLRSASNIQSVVYSRWHEGNIIHVIEYRILLCVYVLVWLIIRFHSITAISCYFKVILLVTCKRAASYNISQIVYFLVVPFSLFSIAIFIRFQWLSYVFLVFIVRDAEDIALLLRVSV